MVSRCRLWLITYCASAFAPTMMRSNTVCKVSLLHLKTLPNPSPCGLLSVIPGVFVGRDRGEAPLSFGKEPILVENTPRNEKKGNFY